MKAGYPKGKFKTRREWHLYSVYNDPAFDKDIAKLKETVSSIAEDYNDQSPDKYKAAYGYIKKKYCVTEGDIQFYMFERFGEQRPINFDSQGLNINYDEGSGSIIWIFSPLITHDELEDGWPQIQYIRNIYGITKRIRHKPFENPKLIYAIFRARPGKTFKEIFNMYQAGKLSYYKKTPENIFDTKESLEAYYHKYSPKLPKQSL